ncbi:fructose-specific PTS transporter subunit EIIC [Spiroplasma endosymbiont of Nebria brevicollis]|uniref:PTS fructose transporter subunit IIABC n=1 Tax=Spiroplasma endosymbiont of Nebria brevicollis TaxID=3066284 RepID=UPI00313B562F
MSKQDILTSQQVFLDDSCTTQDEVFIKLAQEAQKLGLLKKGSSIDTLVKSFKAREEEGTTGFGDGVAVPHARNEDIVKAGIFIVRFKKTVEWKAMDEQPVQAIIALIVPLKSASNEHLTILSKVAQKLAKPDFQELLLKSSDIEAIIAGLAIDDKDSKTDTMKPESTTSKDGKKKIVAITACPVGVAHTYIAQDKLELAAKTLGHNIKVETHGSIGIKGTLTKEDIASADLVIIAVAAGAADLGLERFVGKPLYQLEITKVIKDPEGSMNEAFAEAKPFETKGGNSKNSSGDAAEDMFTTDKKGIMKHIMAGVGYMVPFVVFGGIMIALSIGLTKAIYGPSVDPATLEPNFLYFMFKAGVAGFTLMIPILAGYIAYSIAGRAALVPAMTSAFIANTVGLVYPIAGLESNVSSGFLGALLIGPVAGYLVKWMISWKVPKTIAPIMPIFVIPIIATFLISFTFMYAIGAPIAWLMQQLQDGLTKLPTAAMAAIGLLLGAMVGFDMGGPINKIAFLTASGLVASGQGDPNTQIFMGAVAAAIPVAPIGMGLTTMIFRKYFNEGEKTLGLTALLMGCIGISEGAIPFAVRDPKRAIISNIVGSAVAGCIAGAFFLTDAAAHGGPIVAVLGAVGALHYHQGIGIALFFLAIIVGALITCFMYGGLLIIQSRNIRVFKIMSDKINKTFKKKPTIINNPSTK